MEEYILMGQLLVIGGLGYVLFLIRQIAIKPPLQIRCECFNDMSHDDMVKVKELYKTMLGQREEGGEETKEENKEGEVKQE
jgi:hypothetical protein